MATHYFPLIVTNGLVLALDAANKKSYPGSGTTWFDISGNGINFTMVGSPTLSSGHFTNFTEASNYFQIADTNNVSKLPLGTADRTIVALCRTPSVYNAAISHVFHYGTDTTDQAFGLSILGSGSRLSTHTWGGAPSADVAIPTDTNTFLAVSYTSSSSLHRFYRDGVELSSSSPTRAINTGAGTRNARVGARISTAAELWQTTGRIAVVLVYNRVLTPVEIKQNFNAYRGRYNL